MAVILDCFQGAEKMPCCSEELNNSERGMQIDWEVLFRNLAGISSEPHAGGDRREHADQLGDMSWST